jgi:hypothetical protein
MPHAAPTISAALAAALLSTAASAQVGAWCPPKPGTALAIDLGDYRGSLQITRAPGWTPVTARVGCPQSGACVCGVDALADGTYVVRFSGQPAATDPTALSSKYRLLAFTLKGGMLSVADNAIASIDPDSPITIKARPLKRVSIDFRGYLESWGIESWPLHYAADGQSQAITLLPETVYALTLGSGIAEMFSVDAAGALHHESADRQSFAIDPANPTRARLRTTLVHLAPVDGDGTAEDADAVWTTEYGTKHTGPDTLVLADSGAYHIYDQRTQRMQWLVVTTSCLLEGNVKGPGENVTLDGFRAAVLSGPCDPTNPPEHLPPPKP